MLWLPLLPLLAYTAWRAWRETSWPTLLAGVTALALRARSARVPANWYVDLQGPAAMHPAAFARRHGVGDDLFAALARALPVTDAWVFAASTAFSALAVWLLCAAAWRASRGSTAWRVAAGLWGAMLACDPRLVYLGSTDAPHNAALACFAAALWWFGDASSAACATPTRARLALGYAAAMVGAVRPELAPSALVIPWLLPCDGARRWSAAAVTLVSVAVALSMWQGDDLGVALRAPTAVRAGQWLAAHAPWFVSVWWVPLLVACVARRDARWIAPVACYLALAAPRVVTDFYRGAWVTGARAAGAVCRYDIVVGPVLLLGVALAVGVVAEALAPCRRGVRAAAVAALVTLFVAVWVPCTTDGRGRFPVAPMPFQAEYVFLRGALAAVPRGATVIAVWTDHLPSRRVDPDTGLAWPSALLGYARPDLHFVATSPERPVTLSRGQWFFRGALCDVDPDSAAAPDEDRAYLARVAAQCAALDAQVTRRAAVAHPRAEGIYWQLRGGRATLSLGAL